MTTPARAPQHLVRPPLAMQIERAWFNPASGRVVRSVRGPLSVAEREALSAHMNRDLVAAAIVESQTARTRAMSTSGLLRLLADLAPSPRKVCSWCKGVMAEGTPGAETSHVCCATCAATLMADSQECVA